jgi:hypothetical protein
MLLDPKGQQTLLEDRPGSKGTVSQDQQLFPSCTSGKTNFNFGQSATLFLKKRDQYKVIFVQKKLSPKVRDTLVPA